MNEMNANATTTPTAEEKSTNGASKAPKPDLEEVLRDSKKTLDEFLAEHTDVSFMSDDEVRTAAKALLDSEPIRARELLEHKQAQARSEKTNLGRPFKPTEGDLAIFAASKKKLLELCSRELTQRSLLEITKTADLLRQLVMVGGAPEFSPRRLGMIGGVDDYSAQLVSYPSPATSMGALSPSSPSENFGANIIREAMAFFAEQKKGQSDEAAARTLASTIEAIALAKEKGLTSLATRLEAKAAKLLGESEELEERQHEHEDQKETST